MLESTMQNSSNSTVEKAFESMFGKEKHGRVRCYGRTMTSSRLKMNQEVVVVQKAAALQMNGMAKKIEGLEVVVKVLIQKQNPEFNEEDVHNMLSRFLGKEDSANVPQSSASTHVPNFNQVKIFFNYEFVTNMCKILDIPWVETCFTPCCHGLMSLLLQGDFICLDLEKFYINCSGISFLSFD